MQINAGIPAELIDVLQATILLFLVADAGPRDGSSGCGAPAAASASTDTFTRSYGARGGRLMDQLISALYAIPVLGLVFQFAGYLIDVAPAQSRRSSSSRARPDRARGPVRRDVRAIGRREHRHRGDDADRRPSSAGSPASSSRR